MKLIHRTYLVTSLGLIPLVVLGSIFCFYMIRHISYEETDEFLTYEMQRLQSYHQANNDLPAFSKVADVIENVPCNAPVFRDTLMLEEGDNEMVPYRELRFGIEHNGVPFTIVLRHLLPGNDDILEGTLLIIPGLMIGMAIMLFLLIQWVSGRVWKPFYRTLQSITQHHASDPPPVLPPTPITEFTALNNTLNTLLSRVANDFDRVKEFNENASHELQTYAAVIRSNSEKLINELNDNPQAEQALQNIHQAAVQLSNSQRGLLLLSRIGNREFRDTRTVDLKPVVEHTIELFAEAMQLMQIRQEITLHPCTVQMDPGLASVLLNNLIKNAVKYNVEGGMIQVKLDAQSLTIINTGPPAEGNPRDMIPRFAKGTGGNTGIGLSIVKQICDIYAFTFSYSVSSTDVHTVTIRFS